MLGITMIVQRSGNQFTPHSVTGRLTRNGKSYQYLFFHQSQFLVLVYKDSKKDSKWA